ncbi:MAG: phage tail protein I [Paraburkholderia sp.]|uniref:phage tail protein I n=1 Tax=Paraburkholderia sp. TaxID=1926495 RepID=UPI00121ED807|nr:phage tail protein I [Paraburkholderia sp.]TAM00811.1 MAG: phage tail protein I [Paraburkholderia sp.]
MSKTPLTPVLMADERFRILAELVDERFGNIDLSALLVYLIDTVHESALPHLAEQFHVMGFEGWELARSAEERRALIHNAIELHRYKGTPWAIEQILVTLGMTGVVSEWFEYGGSPYRFRLDIDLSGRGVNADEYACLEALILKYKNKRSRLEALTMSATVRSPIPTFATAVSAGEIVTVYPCSVSELDQMNPLPRIGIGHWGVETVTVYPDSVSALDQMNPLPRIGIGHWGVETVSVYPCTA